MGATGNVTGRHLHLECSETQAWQCSTFINPCTILGIPNEEGTIIKYEETPTPPSPTKSKNSLKWLYSRCRKITIFR